MIEVTKHAARRVRQRMGVNKRAVKGVAIRAWRRGTHWEAVEGPLRDYLRSKVLRYRTACDMKVYGDFIFVFAGESLVTCYPVPPEYRRK